VAVAPKEAQETRQKEESTHKMSDEEIKTEIDHINAMDHYSMCALWRNAPAGHPYFDSTKPFHEHFKKRLFDELGGFTPEISKSIGWD
jgi:hypothetical protein